MLKPISGRDGWDGIGFLNPSLLRTPLERSMVLIIGKLAQAVKINSFHLFQEKLEEKNSGQDLVEQLCLFLI